MLCNISDILLDPSSAKNTSIGLWVLAP